MRFSVCVLTAALLGLTACASTASRTATQPAERSSQMQNTRANRAHLPRQGQLQFAYANLTPASGTLVSGHLQLVAVEGGVRVHGKLGGLNRNGTHAFHIHEHGDCSAADASSAGGHFNPVGENHGRSGHGAHHLGDADNLRADHDGTVDVNVVFPDVVIGGGAINDILGKAFVVHAQADDYQSQPAGNAGARIACGVIQSQ